MSTVWGIDVSTKLIAVAIAVDGPPVTVGWCASLSLDQSRTPQLRLARAVQDATAFFGGACGFPQDLEPPRLIVVEQPFGHNVHPQSYYMVSAVLISLVAALGATVDVRMLGPSKWKLLAWDHGGLGKDDLMVRAREKWPVDNQDEADAVGIALAAASCV